MGGPAPPSKVIKAAGRRDARHEIAQRSSNCSLEMIFDIIWWPDDDCHEHIAIRRLFSAHFDNFTLEICDAFRPGDPGGVRRNAIVDQGLGWPAGASSGNKSGAFE